MDELTERQLGATNIEHVQDMQSVFEASPSYFLAVEGKPAAYDAAEKMFLDLPPGKAQADKIVLGYYRATNPVGCAEIVRGYPEPRIALIGLLLFAESSQGRFHGPWALKRIEMLARTWCCSVLRIGVIADNTRALAFWSREGFVECSRKHLPQFTSIAIAMERAL
jgi:GNAT superfamily N-acetyltransferase